MNKPAEEGLTANAKNGAGVAKRRQRGCRDAAGVLAELKQRRQTFPSHCIRLMAFDATRGAGSIAMSFIDNRPRNEPGSGLARTGGAGRTMRYRSGSCATGRPEAERCGA